MRVKVTQKGWSGFTGLLGMVHFEDGVSVTDISLTEALALGAFITVVEINDAGEELGQVSPAVEMLKTNKMSARVDRSTLIAERIQDKPSDTVEIENLTDTVETDSLAEARYKQAQAEKLPEPKVIHTPESLEAIANAKGIQGLREIGTPLGARNTSIKGLMSEILAAQAGGATIKSVG